MTLACEVVTVAGVDAEKPVDDSLVQIWKQKFGRKVKLFFGLLAQGLVKILMMNLRQDFEAEVWSVFCRQGYFAVDAWLR